MSADSPPGSRSSESHWVLWRLWCAPGFARSACLTPDNSGRWWLGVQHERRRMLFASSLACSG